jgi:hypothetical protein
VRALAKPPVLSLFGGFSPRFIDHILTGALDNREAQRRFCDADHRQVGHKHSIARNFHPALADVIINHHEAVTPESPASRLLVRAHCVAANSSGFHTISPQPEWDPALHRFSSAQALRACA